MVLAASAQQGQRRFSPERFQAEMEQYIIQEAKLSTQEADRFLPIFREMHQKQRVIYECQRQLRHTNLSDETAYMEAIRKNDQMDIELKTIQKKMRLSTTQFSIKTMSRTIIRSNLYKID
jgi:hypothetical protein